MNDGGPKARQGYRFQDDCAMYFTLEEYINHEDFEYVYCENDKLDFEIWSVPSFTGYQVKTNPDSLTARETNKVLLFYLDKSILSGKTQKAFRFIFAKHPSHSLDHLFTRVRNKDMSKIYDKRRKTFIDTALENVPTEVFSIDFRYFERKEISDLVFAASSRLLQEKLGTTNTQVVRSFVARLREEIENISSDDNAEKRHIKIKFLNDFIDQFLIGVRGENRKDEGTSSESVGLPEKAIERIVERILERKRIGEVAPPEVKTVAKDGQVIDN